MILDKFNRYLDPFFAFGNLVKSSSNKVRTLLTDPNKYSIDPEVALASLKSAEKSNALFLFVNGFLGVSCFWQPYIDALEESSSGAHIFSPLVPHRGNCSLEIAAEPLYKIVRLYAEKFPQAPMYLIGTSNGARILFYIEKELDKELLLNRKVRVVSIAGVHLGTPLANLLLRSGLYKLAKISKDFLEEVSWESPFSSSFLKEWKEKVSPLIEKNEAYKHLWAGTKNDEILLGEKSAFPFTEEEVRHEKVVVSCESHTSIVGGLCPQILKWLDFPAIN